jgi:hypothetical protein
MVTVRRKPEIAEQPRGWADTDEEQDVLEQVNDLLEDHTEGK